MTKLWPYEVSLKTGKMKLRRDVAERCRNTASRRREVRGWFWVDFHPILSPELRLLKLKPQEDKKRWLGLEEGDFVHTLGPKKRL